MNKCSREKFTKGKTYNIIRFGGEAARARWNERCSFSYLCMCVCVAHICTFHNVNLKCLIWELLAFCHSSWYHHRNHFLLTLNQCFGFTTYICLFVFFLAFENLSSSLKILSSFRPENWNLYTVAHQRNGGTQKANKKKRKHCVCVWEKKPHPFLIRYFICIYYIYLPYENAPNCNSNVQ